MTETRAMALAWGFVNFLQKWRYAILLLVAALTLMACLSMRHIRVDNSHESFFEKSDPAILAIDRFRELFGNEDAVYVAVHSEAGVFNLPFLKKLEALADALDASVPYLEKVTWIGSAEYMRGAGQDEIQTGPLYEEIPEDPAELERFRQKALAYPDFVNTLISEDAKTAIIVLECDHYPEDVKDPRKAIAPAVYQILERPEFAGLKTHFAGAPVQDFEQDRITKRQTLKLTLICLLLQAVLLLCIGRGGIRAVVAPVAVIMICVILTMGIVSLAGWTVSMMDVMLPTMLFSVCVGDTVHIIASYHQHRDNGLPHMEAMAHMMREVFVPCLFTSLTTMMGFASFLSTNIVPVRMAGVYSAIGVLIAFLLAITLTPIAYLLHPEKEARFHKKRRISLDKLDRFLQVQVVLCLKHPVLVVLFFALTSAASVLLYQSVVVETNAIKDIGTSEKVRQDADYFDTNLGGAMALEIIVDSGRENGARDLHFLRDVERLQRYAETFPQTVKTHSVVDTLMRVREVLHNEDPACHALPEVQQQVSQYLFFYETSGGKNLDKEMSLLGDVVRIHIQTRNMGTQAVQAFMAGMDDFVATQLGGRLHVQYTGQMAWVAAIADYVRQGQLMSLLCALFSIGAMMILCLRSFKLGCISMLPNIVPILMPMGLMGLFGINLSLVLMIFSSVIMGVCVDDTTHFYVHFKHHYARTRNYRASVFATLRAVGRPVVFTSVALIAGFLVFTLSVVRTTGQFGILGAAAFFWGCLADLTLSPALVVLLKPLGRRSRHDSRAKQTDSQPALRQGGASALLPGRSAFSRKGSGR